MADGWRKMPDRPVFQATFKEITLMRWAILIAVLAFGALRDVEGAEMRCAVSDEGRMTDVHFAASPVAGRTRKCAAGCTWSQLDSCPACARRVRWAYHGPYYRRPYDYRRSFDFPWSYAPYNPAVYWVSDDASAPVDEAPPPLPVPAR